MLNEKQIETDEMSASYAGESLDDTVDSDRLNSVQSATHTPKDAVEKFSGDTDAFQRYLIGISKYRLLTRSEEQVLFKQVKEYNDKQAAQRLVTSNLRLVVKIAMNYSSLWMQNLLDLIQEGNLGLIRAVEKFDPSKNVKFSYYASFWIKAYIIKHLMDNWRLVKIGTTQAQRKLFFKLKSEKRKLRDAGYMPSAELISDRLNVPKKDVIEMDQRINGWDVSLDAPLTEESDTARIDLLHMPVDSLDNKVSQKELKAILRRHIRSVCKEMDSRELHIFNQRIIAEDPKTLSEIGKKFGISRERVRQIQKGIITKFKESFNQHLPDFATYKADSFFSQNVEQ